MLEVLWAVTGMLLTFAALWLRKVLGQLQEHERRLHSLARTIAENAAQMQGQISEINTKGLTPKWITDLSSRVHALEKRVAEMDLEVLDTVEKVAHRLADRERKRARREEVPDGDHDEAPNDPGALLAAARAAYPLPQIPLALGN